MRRGAPASTVTPPGVDQCSTSPISSPSPERVMVRFPEEDPRDAPSGLDMSLGLYTGAHLPWTTGGGRTHGPFAALAIEPQHIPDAPNRPWAPSPVLRPGDTYAHHLEFRLTIAYLTISLTWSVVYISSSLKAAYSAISGWESRRKGKESSSTACQCMTLILLYMSASIVS